MYAVHNKIYYCIYFNKTKLSIFEYIARGVIILLFKDKRFFYCEDVVKLLYCQFHRLRYYYFIVCLCDWNRYYTDRSTEMGPKNSLLDIGCNYTSSFRCHYTRQLEDGWISEKHIFATIRNYIKSSSFVRSRNLQQQSDNCKFYFNCWHSFFLFPFRLFQARELLRTTDMAS